MRVLLGSVFIALFMGACSDDAEESFMPKQYSIEDFYKNRNVLGGYFSPDASRLLVTSNQTGIYNAYALPVDGSPAVQLTSSTEESIFAISYFPNDERLLFSSDKGGNEINHIYRRELDGTAVDLTPAETAKSEFVGWAKDLTSFFYISNARDESFFDLYEMDIESFGSKEIYRNEEGLDVAAISDDKRYLALVKPITTSNSDMYLYDRESEELQLLSEHEGDVQFSPQYFSRDNAKLYYLTDEDSEFQKLMAYDLNDGSTETVFETNWDVWYAYESYNGKFRVVGYNADG